MVHPRPKKCTEQEASSRLKRNISLGGQCLECGNKVPPPSVIFMLSFPSGSVVLVATNTMRSFTQTLSHTMQIEECQNKFRAPFRLFCKRRHQPQQLLMMKPLCPIMSEFTARLDPLKSMFIARRSLFTCSKWLWALGWSLQSYTERTWSLVDQSATHSEKGHASFTVD